MRIRLELLQPFDEQCEESQDNYKNVSLEFRQNERTKVALQILPWLFCITLWTYLLDFCLFHLDRPYLFYNRPPQTHFPSCSAASKIQSALYPSPFAKAKISHPSPSHKTKEGYKPGCTSCPRPPVPFVPYHWIGLAL